MSPGRAEARQGRNVSDARTISNICKAIVQAEKIFGTFGTDAGRWAGSIGTEAIAAPDVLAIAGVDVTGDSAAGVNLGTRADLQSTAAFARRGPAVPSPKMWTKLTVQKR